MTFKGQLSSGEVFTVYRARVKCSEPNTEKALRAMVHRHLDYFPTQRDRENTIGFGLLEDFGGQVIHESTAPLPDDDEDDNDSVLLPPPDIY